MARHLVEWAYPRSCAQSEVQRRVCVEMRNGRVFCTDPMGSSLLLAFTDPDLPWERLNSRVLLFPKAYAPQAGYTNPSQFNWSCREKRKSVYVQLVKNCRDYTEQLTAYSRTSHGLMVRFISEAQTLLTCHINESSYLANSLAAVWL